MSVVTARELLDQERPPTSVADAAGVHAEYRQLVIDLADDNEVEAERVENVLFAAMRSPSQLNADVARVTKRRQWSEQAARADEAEVELPELAKQKAELQARLALIIAAIEAEANVKIREVRTPLTDLQARTRELEQARKVLPRPFAELYKTANPEAVERYDALRGQLVEMKERELPKLQKDLERLAGYRAQVTLFCAGQWKAGTMPDWHPRPESGGPLTEADRLYVLKFIARAEQKAAGIRERLDAWPAEKERIEKEIEEVAAEIRDPDRFALSK